GELVRDALLWNDNRSAPDAEDLIAEWGGPAVWADAVGSVPVASMTVSKIRWLARCEPDNAARTAAVVLPHDWLTWQLGRRAVPPRPRPPGARGRAAPRLADVAARRGVVRPGHRPRGRLGHLLLRRHHRGVPAGPDR